MKRKTFLRNSALCAIAMSTPGFIRFNGVGFEGDCETTSDILGPFYRPNSPVRNNLRIANVAGTPVELSGIIRQSDCKTPCKKAKIELWHCDSAGVYDNSSDEYRYRATLYTDDNGRYSVKSILPPPYDAGGFIRPAHFHMMITADGYQPLVTQLYFSGDKNITTDTWASASKAKRRILKVDTVTDGSRRVRFDVGMSVKLAVEPASINSLTGTYSSEQDQARKLEFFKHGNALWVKNEVFGMELEYVDVNRFQPAGTPEAGLVYHFEILPSGSVRLTYPFRKDNKIVYGVAVK